MRPLTFALLAISLVARLADTVVGLGRVLAQGVDVAVVRTFCTLVWICTNVKNERSIDVTPNGFSEPMLGTHLSDPHLSAS